jgi:gluconate 2-dehydrogenase gamma chain
VPVFIDRQLASAWGGGDRMYRAGPLRQGHTGAGVPAAADAASVLCRGHSGRERVVRETYGKSFDRLEQAKREEALTAMQRAWPSSMVSIPSSSSTPF